MYIKTGYVIINRGDERQQAVAVFTNPDVARDYLKYECAPHEGDVDARHLGYEIKEWTILVFPGRDELTAAIFDPRQDAFRHVLCDDYKSETTRKRCSLRASGLAKLTDEEKEALNVR